MLALFEGVAQVAPSSIINRKSALTKKTLQCSGIGDAQSLAAR